MTNQTSFADHPLTTNGAPAVIDIFTPEQLKIHAPEIHAAVPHLLVIDNMQCVPDMGWPKEMIAYQWSQYDALSEIGIAVRNYILEQDK
jgi:hypothetical protein